MRMIGLGLLPVLALTAWADVAQAQGQGQGQRQGQGQAQRPPAPRAETIAGPGVPGWVVDRANGCWVWNENPERGETVRWSGPCPEGPATGEGSVTWRVTENRRVRNSSYVGSLSEGRPDGRGVFIGPYGSRSEGSWRAGRQHGLGSSTAPSGHWYVGLWRDGRPDGQGEGFHPQMGSFVGIWADGCLKRADGSVWAVGRPVSECR